MYLNKTLGMAQILLVHLKAAPDKTGMYVLFHKAQMKTRHQDQYRSSLAPSLLID